MASKVILLVYFFGVALAQIRMTATVGLFITLKSCDFPKLATYSSMISASPGTSWSPLAAPTFPRAPPTSTNLSHTPTGIKAPPARPPTRQASPPTASYPPPNPMVCLLHLSHLPPASGSNTHQLTLSPTVIGSSQYKPDQSDPSNYPAKRIAVAAPYRSFDLLSFSYGCSLLTTTIASSCAIAVTGTYANGQQVPAASFNYFRGQLSQSGMFLAQLPDYYRGLREVVVGVASGEDGTGPTEQVLDSLVYNVNF